MLWEAISKELKQHFGCNLLIGTFSIDDYNGNYRGLSISTTVSTTSVHISFQEHTIILDFIKHLPLSDPQLLTKIIKHITEELYNDKDRTKYK